MVVKNIFLVTIISLYCLCGFAQDKFIGKVVDGQTGESLMFAHVINLNYNEGTVTNKDGIFSLKAAKEDSIAITYIGYLPYFSTFDKMSNHVIELYPDANLLSEISIVSTTKSAYDILIETRNRLKQNIKTEHGKTYLLVNTTADDEPIEFSQSFYNASLCQGSITDLSFKNGQSYLARMKEGGWFLNLDMSKAFSMYSIIEGNKVFPKNPFELNKRKLKRKYNLKIEESNRSYLRISFEPKKNILNFSKGEIWVDPVNFNLIKYVMIGKDDNKIFLPFGHIKLSDTEYTVDYNYSLVDGNNLLSHISINYNTKVTDAKVERKVTTEAIMHIAKHKQSYYLSKFKTPARMSDYDLLSLIPDTLIFNSLKNSDHIELTDPQQLNLNKLQTHGRKFEGILVGNNILQNNYIEWSPTNRIKIDYTPKETEPRNIGARVSRVISHDFTSNKFQISSTIYLDMTTENDEVIVETNTILDRFNSFNYLDSNLVTHVYANIHFDLTEVFRRKFLALIKDKSLTQVEVEAILTNINLQLVEKQSELQRDLFEGENISNLVMWNNYIYDELKVDNFHIFEISKELLESVAR